MSVSRCPRVLYLQCSPSESSLLGIGPGHNAFLLPERAGRRGWGSMKLGDELTRRVGEESKAGTRDELPQQLAPPNSDHPPACGRCLPTRDVTSHGRPRDKCGTTCPADSRLRLDTGLSCAFPCQRDLNPCLHLERVLEMDSATCGDAMKCPSTCGFASPRNSSLASSCGTPRGQCGASLWTVSYMCSRGYRVSIARRMGSRDC